MRKSKRIANTKSGPARQTSAGECQKEDDTDMGEDEGDMDVDEDWRESSTTAKGKKAKGNKGKVLPQGNVVKPKPKPNPRQDKSLKNLTDLADSRLKAKDNSKSLPLWIGTRRAGILDKSIPTKY